MSTENIRLSLEDSIATLVIDRPHVRNALDPRTVEECLEALRSLPSQAETGVLVITGAGDRAFVSGADIRAIRDRQLREGLAGISASLCNAVERFPWPTIAAVNGYALGGGCELALACDIRIAADTARFGLPEVGLGIIPAAGGTQRLPRIVGLGHAKHLVLTGEVIDARRAYDIGLVTLVVPAADLRTRARDLAQRMLRQGPLAVRLAKLALSASARVDVDSGLLIETLAQTICYQSEDKQEGTTAFLEKRPARFKGR